MATRMTDRKHTVTESNKRTILAAQLTRDEFIYESFVRDHPDYKDLNIEQVRNFVSRSKHMQKWFLHIMEEYRITYEMPEVAREILDRSDFEAIKDKLAEYSDSLRNEGDDIAAAAKQFNETIKGIRDREAKIRKNIASNKLIRILTLTSESLPLKLQYSILKFNPDKTKVLVDGKTDEYITDIKDYQKHVFKQWIKGLLVRYKKGEDVDPIIDADLKDWGSGS